VCLCTYDVDEFLKNNSQVNVLFCLLLVIILLLLALLFLHVRIYDRPGSNCERVGHVNVAREPQFADLCRLL
jgi:hypothetical protein